MILLSTRNVSDSYYDFVNRCYSRCDDGANQKCIRTQHLRHRACLKCGCPLHDEAQRRSHHQHQIDRWHRVSLTSFPTVMSSHHPGPSTTPWNALYCAARAALHSITEGLSMELEPFGVNVMLVAPGGVKSNISKNHASMFKLPPNSMYKDYEQRMTDRMNMAANPHSMPTDEFAKQVLHYVHGTRDCSQPQLCARPDTSFGLICTTPLLTSRKATPRRASLA